MYLRAFLLLFFELCFSVASAQTITLSGRVTNKDTGETLEFASISIKGKPIGMISNTQGEFDFHLSAEFKNETLVVSMLGFRNFEAPIKSFNSTDFLSVQLETSTTLLPEVVVKDSLSGGDLLRIALDRIDENSPQNPFLLNGFYRDVKKVGGTYISLLEAAVQIYDEDYREPRNKHKLRERVKLVELRQSLGYESKFTAYFDQVNLLEDLLLHNDVRYRNFPEEEVFFKGLDRKPNTTFNGNEVYVVTHTKDYNLTVYIEKGTYGILHLSFESNLMDDNQRKGPMISRFVYVKREITFNRIDNKLHLSYLSMNSKVNWFDVKTNDLKFETELFQQLLINKINPDPEERIASTESMKKYGLQYQNYKYDKAFWENYNVIKHTPLDSQIVADLEKAGPLEKQFRDN